MANKAVAERSTYTYGDDFNYATWPKNSVATLVNVPWNNDYRDIVRFDDQDALDRWIGSRETVEVRNMSRLEFQQNVKIPTPFNTALKYNYLRASNGLRPINGDTRRNYYYFILDARAIGSNNTELVLQLDVWQTFGYDVAFGNVFIERGHVAIANSNNFNHYGRDYLTVPEGLDVGGEYRIVHVEREKIIDSAGDSDVDPGYDVLICSTLDLTQDPGTASNPAIKSATGQSFEGMPTGANFYLFKTGQDLRTFFLKYSDKPWVTQSIISITLVPNAKRYNSNFDYGANLSTDASFKFYSADGKFLSAIPRARKMMVNWRAQDFIKNILGSQYGILKKFMTYPYMILELTTLTGSPIIIKPESWQDADAQVKEYAAFLPPGQRIAISPVRYNADGETLTGTQPASATSEDDNGEFLNFATFLDNFPTLPVVNNMAISYLAQNKNGLAFQQRSADWSQQRALAGAQASYDNSGAELSNTARQSSIGNSSGTERAAIAARAASTNQAIGNLTGMVGNPISGATGVAGTALQGIMETSAAQQSLAMNQVDVGARSAGALSSIQAGSAIRDTNVGLARFAAKGNYENDIAGINAKVQDAAMIQPSTSGQFGGDAFNIIRGNFGYSLRWKMPNLNALRTIGDFWLRYGYAVNQYGRMPANYACMTRFTYWKCRETYITGGAMPEMFKQALRGLFEKGVTVWTKPEYIGTTALADNVPLDGISY